jgi:hypothetical protein
MNMEQFVVRLKDKRKRNFFLELIKQLEFVEIVKPKANPQQVQFTRNLITAFEEVKSHQKGKTKLKSLDQVLNEL